jgi:phage baseplate assembly protein W
MALYKGISTYKFDETKNIRVDDIDLVEIDLLNHIFTSTDERVMMPGFGTIIPQITFEPLTSELVADVRDDLIRVVEYDPRVELLDINVEQLPDQNTLTVSMTLRYIELNAVKELSFNLNLDSGTGV